MKAALLPGLILLTGCAGQPFTPDFFASQADFAAKRQVETMVIDVANQDQACAHVTAVLMDLDCELVEINGRLGVISGQPSARTTRPQLAAYLPFGGRSCGGRRVTATVTESSNGQQLIRASFSPESADADQAFRTLLRRSVETAPQED